MKNRKKTEEVQITGHEWDGITEYNNPDPFYLRMAIYCAIFFALVYWILYPSWPTPHNTGLLGWSSYKELAAEQAKIDALRAVYQERFDKASFEQVMADEELMKFALAGGQSTFANNCAVCHGAGGGGNAGYPNLTAGAWLWGGKIEDIYTTIQYGIRSGHEEARDSAMAAFGVDKILTPDQILLLVDYVKSLSTPNINTNSEAAGLFHQNCASCHGEQGQGNRDVGAPALNDAVWLYGSENHIIYDVIFKGRAGVMPYWRGKLSDSTIRQVAIYVHQLGGGEYN